LDVVYTALPEQVMKDAGIQLAKGTETIGLGNKLKLQSYVGNVLEE
jgi:hypothetical protein